MQESKGKVPDACADHEGRCDEVEGEREYDERGEKMVEKDEKGEEGVVGVDGAVVVMINAWVFHFRREEKENC